MTQSQTILLPMYRGVVHAYIEQGTHWSVVEHLLLFALCQKPSSMDGLAQAANLPKSIVVEAVVRLMRASWVEILTDRGGAKLQASNLGRQEALKSSLTPIVRRFQRKLHFAIDRVTATVLGVDGVTLKHARDIAELRRHCTALDATASDDATKLGYLELIDRLSSVPSIIRPDEKIVGCDPYRSSIDAEWYLVLTVSGDSIEGLPSTPARSLLEGIRREIVKHPSKQQEQANEAIPPTSVEYSHKAHSIKFCIDDLLLGGQAHRDALRSAIVNARRRVIVHSTFLSAGGLEAQLDVLTKVAEGVRVDLLWDRSEDGKGTKAFNACRELLERADLLDRVRLWSFQTRSHAKQLIADDGEGGYFAIVGSCNWLSSPFKSYEVSVRLRSAVLVSECLGFIEKMLPHDSDAGDLKEELISLGVQLRLSPQTSGADLVRLLPQGDHEAMIGQVRDSAKLSVFVASNRAGNVVETQVLAPFDSAIQNNPNLNVSVHYQSERKGSALTPDVLKGLKRRYDRIRIDTIQNAHAKLLCWDSDHTVITSLNWLSKDASAANFVGECGVYIESAGIADHLRAAYLRAAAKEGE